MAVDLSTLVPNVRNEVDGIGNNYFPNLTDQMVKDHLSNGFWEAYLDGFYNGIYSESAGVVTPSGSGSDMPRDLQQLVIFYAALRILRLTLRNARTRLNYQAGPARYETEQSANVLRDAYQDLLQRRSLLLKRLSDTGQTPTVVYDRLLELDYSTYNAQNFWPRA